MEALVVYRLVNSDFYVDTREGKTIGARILKSAEIAEIPVRTGIPETTHRVSARGCVVLTPPPTKISSRLHLACPPLPLRCSRSPGNSNPRTSRRLSGAPAWTGSGSSRSRKPFAPSPRRPLSKAPAALTQPPPVRKEVEETLGGGGSRKSSLHS